MILAELELYHSRPVAPTRRVAVGKTVLPVGEVGFGGLLLGGVVARYSKHMEADLLDDLLPLIRELERGQHVPQPRLRHRFQKDRIGLSRSVHRLERTGSKTLRFSFEERHDAPTKFVLAAVYAAGALDYNDRGPVFEVIRRAIGWQGDAEQTEQLLAHLSPSMGGFSLVSSGFDSPIEWALDVLGLDASAGEDFDPAEVQRQFRTMLRSAHPDIGGETDDAADRIAELSKARDILLPKT